MRFFNFNFISNKILDRNKREMLRYLETIPVEQLAALGFSTTLMEQGVGAWPWREDSETNELAKIDQMLVDEQRNVSELQAYTDAELHDLGLTRGLIKHAVRHGRAGIDEPSIARAA